MFRFMEDRKSKIQISKKFFNEFMFLMDHYELVQDSVKKIWKMSMHPEEFKDQPRVSAEEDRETKIAALKEKKLLEAQIEKLKESEDIKDVREFNVSLIKHAILKAADSLKTIDMEFQILVYRDSLPAEARVPPKKPVPGTGKKMEVFHIPKGAGDNMPYMLGADS